MKRREWFTITAGASAVMGLTPRLLAALQQGQLIKRAIPSSGEMIPVVGLGSSATFSQVARTEDVTALKEVFRTMVEKGASVFDTAPGYGASEQVAGGIVNELGIADRIFWATKLNVAGRGGGSADPAAARAQVERSFDIVKKKTIELIQVHNLADVPNQLAVLRPYKKDGRVKYIGVTTTSDSQYGELEQYMRNEPLDFIGIDYAADNRGVAERILPLAQERKIGVMAYVPFGRTSLFRRVGDRPLPDWAATIDATTWAQVFIKYVVSHPAVTVVTPATSQSKHMLDNIAGGVGRLPNQSLRAQIEQFVDALPQAQRGR